LATRYLLHEHAFYISVFYDEKHAFPFPLVRRVNVGTVGGAAVCWEKYFTNRLCHLACCSEFADMFLIKSII
jgi:hypothetical protein